MKAIKWGWKSHCCYFLGYSRSNTRTESNRDYYSAYTGGMSEDEQMRRATEESRRYFTRSQGTTYNNADFFWC